MHSTRLNLDADDFSAAVSGFRGYRSDHLGGVMSSDSDLRSVSAQFLLAGMDNGEKCVFIGHETSRDDLMEAVRQIREVSDDTIEARIEFISTDDFYTAGGRFDSGRVLADLEGLAIDAVKRGYTGMRGVGEMTWCLGKPEGHEGLWDYESQVNNLYPGQKGAVLCQYDDARFEPESLLEVLWTHPRIVYKGTVSCNPYYVLPDQFRRGMTKIVSKEMFSRTVREMARRTKLEELHLMELRNSRLMSRKCSVLDDLAVREIGNMLSVTSFMNELAMEACDNADARDYIERAIANCESIERQLELMHASGLIGKTTTEWQRLDGAWKDAIESHANDRIRVTVDVGDAEILAENLLDIAFRGVLQTLCAEVCGQVDLTVTSQDTDRGLLILVEGSCMGGSARLEDAALRNCRAYGLVLAKEILRASGISLIEPTRPGERFRLEMTVPPGRYR